MIAARIMHVPERPLPTGLIRSLSPLHTTLFTDKEHRGPWWNARRCWTEPTEAEHILVVQDDAAMPEGAAKQMLKAVEARPQAIVSFFSQKTAPDAAWIDFDIEIWGVALCMPAVLARTMVEWVDAAVKDDMPQDDLRVLYFAANRGIPISCAVPSLVEHRPDMMSTVSPRPEGNRGYQAGRLWAGEAVDWRGNIVEKHGDRRPFARSIA